MRFRLKIRTFSWEAQPLRTTGGLPPQVKLPMDKYLWGIPKYKLLSKEFHHLYNFYKIRTICSTKNSFLPNFKTKKREY